MKIKKITPFLLNPGIPKTKNWLFVKVETDEGIHGWGECYTQPDRERAIKVFVEELERYLVGRSPFNIKHFTYAAYNDFAAKRGSMDYYSAVSGIEHALWDIIGKALNQPVYNLLGGACRDKIRVYANGWGNWYSSDDVVENAKRLVKEGFTALKFDPFPGLWREYIDKNDVQNAAEKIKSIRQAVGPDVDLLIENHRRLAPAYAVIFADKIKEYNPYWFEEPVSSRNPSALIKASQRINLPIVTGEELYTKNEFCQIFEKQVADIINPDVANCGGILELKEIAAMAEPYCIGVSPHNYNSTTIALAATLQASAVMPNFIITEYFINFSEVGKIISKNPLEVKNGFIELPSEPGLGLELDESKFSQYTDNYLPKRKVLNYNEEKGGI